MSLQSLPHAQIAPNPDQPRKLFEPKALAELAASILENGLAQPITVRPVYDLNLVDPDAWPRFEIVMGERRWRAHGLLIAQGHTRFAAVACHVREMSARTRDIQAIIENLQRADVTPLEEARAFERLANEGMTVDEISGKIGVAAFRVKWRLSLMNLAPKYQGLLASEQLDRQQAMEMARLPSELEQDRVFRLIQTGKLPTWKAVRSAVDIILEGKSQVDMFGDAPKASEADVEAVRGMEAKIEHMARLASAGWKDGECIVAAKVSRDRARLMADKLKAMRSALSTMESELRQVGAQVEAAFAA